MSRNRHSEGAHGQSGQSWAPYGKLTVTLTASLLVMYLLAFSQIERVSHAQPSMSVFWISLSMVSAMGIIMLIAMPQMLPNRRVNVALLVVFAALLLGAFSAGRIEAGVGDDAFLRSMIPHHSRAIHMCQQAGLSDPEIVDLCGQIIESQRGEIEQMEHIMGRRGGLLP